ncbi:azolemycin family RiPP peptide [Streptomyces sp. NPDC005876]|uniref:azolemycin family RiPP peptide n=1 Tax=unclassified Streptomyces TaxID=2593676 RepID=UPI0033CF1DA2
MTQQTKHPVDTDGESLFEEMTIPESEEAFAGHSCLSWAAPQPTELVTTAPAAS